VCVGHEFVWVNSNLCYLAGKPPDQVASGGGHTFTVLLVRADCASARQS
jgi:hypothetical protein